MSTAESAPDQEERRRASAGPRPLGAVLPAVTRASFRKRAPATVRLLADWAEIVGPALAAVTTPLRLAGGSAARPGGTLTVEASGPIALELQHLAPQLIERINAQAGHALVARMRFVQTPARIAAAAVAMPGRTARPAPAQRPLSPTESSRLARHLAERLAPIGSEPLREALARLGRAVAAASDRTADAGKAAAEGAARPDAPPGAPAPPGRLG
ncbi:MAG: DUF721 domain-containing protein [Alphaproteobacteria bacterium]|nr:DUF721 domain-containing protein [Alphaproteobacteria bacterium]